MLGQAAAAGPGRGAEKCWPPPLVLTGRQENYFNINLVECSWSESLKLWIVQLALSIYLGHPAVKLIYF